MKFIHTADVHLGAEPDAGSAYTRNRPEELWDSFEELLGVCERERTDLLLIAGDLFHRQPLLRELKEVDYLFSKLSHTRVVFIVGNHDYLKASSYYRTFQWSSNVFPILSTELDYVEFEDLGVCVYGLSYSQREIREPLYDRALPGKRQPAEILLAHGGDERHIPINRNKIMMSGYDYVALGHIHRPEEICRNRVYYAGSLEPTDRNDIGKHGYVQGEILPDRAGNHVTAEFVPFAAREYVHLEIMAAKEMTGRALKEKVAEEIQKRGIQNIYKVILTGFRDPDIRYDTAGMDSFGNILEFVDETKPAYDFEKLRRQNEDNLLGRYIESLKDSSEGSVEYRALFEGVRALLETKRG